MDTGKGRDPASDTPSGSDLNAGLFHHWKLEIRQPLEFNPFCPELFKILNQKRTAYYEVMNLPPQGAAGTNVLRSDKPSSERVVSWMEVMNTIELSALAGSFAPGNRTLD